MRKINLDFLLPFSMYLWVVYTIYTVLITIYDFSHIRYVVWEQAENQSTVYSSRRSTTVTYNFVKDNVRISRKYPGILEGINTWLWGINKKDNKLNISFYIRYNDYEKIKKGEIKYRKDIFGGKLNELESIPFFGLRKLNSDSNNVMLWMDIWKYNYKWWIFLIFLLLPSLLIYLIKRVKTIEVVENKNKSKLTKINDYIFWVLSIINIIIFII